jgi:flagellum-specific ATP synthase/type III secretion protein N (ATPase)
MTTPDVVAPEAVATVPDLRRYEARLRAASPIVVRGQVREVIGLLVEIEGISGRLGELCAIERAGEEAILAEIVGFRGERTLAMPLGELRGVQSGAHVNSRGALTMVPVGPGVLGRVLDGLGRPIDGRGPLTADFVRPGAGSSPHVLERRRIEQPLTTGIRALDGLLTCGLGQRIGIFAGSGVGKSTVLGMIARRASSDVAVIALIGERGREVREFIEHDLGPEGLARSVVVVSTSDEPAPLRLNAAWVATTIAEQFRSDGQDVTLLMDSVTRFAMARREIGLALGEPPAMKGYTPSVFSQLSRLLERAGTADKGSITAFYTVLVESDDLNEPIADTVRGTLDGHVVLSRDLAAQNHYPAIDVAASVSRVMPAVASAEHLEYAARLRELLARYERSRDLVQIGAYETGTDLALDEALVRLPAIEAFLRQRPDEFDDLDHTIARLAEVVAGETPPEVVGTAVPLDMISDVSFDQSFNLSTGGDQIASAVSEVLR